MSFRFVSKQSKTSNAVGMSSLIFRLQAKKLRFSVSFNTVAFRNFHRSLNIPEVMKTGLPNLTFLCNFLQLLPSNISLFTVLFTADFGFFLFFLFFFLLLSG